MKTAVSLLAFLLAHFGDLPEDFAMRLQVCAFAMVKIPPLKYIRVVFKNAEAKMSLQEFIEKSETYQEILAEGRTVGLRKGMIKAIITALRHRFGEFDSVNLTARLQAFDEADLDKLVAAAGVYVESFEAFQKLLEAPRTQPTNI